MIGLQEVVQALFSGIRNGPVYGAVGIGFVVTYRITGIVNFAMGDMAIGGAFAIVSLADVLPIWLALPVGMAISAAVAAAFYLGALVPLRHETLLVQTIVTLGAALMLRAGLQIGYGTQPYGLDAFTDGGPLRVAGASLPYQALWIAGIAIVLAIVLERFFEHSLAGLALRACAVNRYAASIVGINIVFMAALSFAISGAVVSAVAASQVPLTFVTVGSGLFLTLKGFIAATLGGLERIWLTLVGGVGLAFVEAFLALTVSSKYQDLFTFALLLGLLMLRPSGLVRSVQGARQ